MSTVAAAAKFTVTADETLVRTYSRKIDAIKAAERLADQGEAEYVEVTNTKTLEVVHTEGEAPEVDEADEDGIECPECGEHKEETSFPTVSRTDKETGRKVVSRNLEECRACRDARLASGGRKVKGVCTIACRTSTHAADDEKSATCQCVCGGAGHGTEAPVVAGE